MKYIQQMVACATIASALMATTMVHAADAHIVLARSADGILVSTTDLMAELNALPESQSQMLLARPNGAEELAERLLLRRVLAAQAVREGLDKDPLVAASVNLGRDKVLSVVRLTHIDTENTPTDLVLAEKAKAVYQTDGIKYSKPVRTRARHILLTKDGPESLKAAQDLLAKLRAGASFEEMAKLHSKDTASAVRGGDLGLFTSLQVVSVFSDAVDALTNPGDLSEPIVSEFGYHIIKLEERRAKGIPPFEEVQDQIMEELRMGALKDARLKVLENLKQNIVFDKAALADFAKSRSR